MEGHLESVTATIRRYWTAVIFASLGLGGAVIMLRGPVIPELATTFGTSETRLGLIPAAGTVGYLLSMAVFGFGAGHLRPKHVIVGGLLGNAAALFALGLAPIYPIFLLGIAAQGAMIGAVRALNRPLLSHFYPAVRGRIYSLYDMTWAIGATLGPVLFVVVVALYSWRAAFLALGACMLGLAVVAWRLQVPGVDAEEEPFGLADTLVLLRRPQVLGMALVMFFVTGVEGGLFTWLPTYVNETAPGTIDGSLVLSVMIAGYVPGRLVYGRLAERVGYVRLVVIVLTLLVPVYAWTFFYASGLAVLPGIFAIGVLISGNFPLLLSWATDAVPSFSGPVTAIAAVAASSGIGVMPALLGVAIGSEDAATGMQLLLLPLLVGLGLIVAVRVAEVRRENG